MWRVSIPHMNCPDVLASYLVLLNFAWDTCQTLSRILLQVELMLEKGMQQTWVCLPSTRLLCT